MPKQISYAIGWNQFIATPTGSRHSDLPTCLISWRNSCPPRQLPPASLNTITTYHVSLRAIPGGRRRASLGYHCRSQCRRRDPQTSQEGEGGEEEGKGGSGEGELYLCLDLRYSLTVSSLNTQHRAENPYSIDERGNIKIDPLVVNVIVHYFPALSMPPMLDLNQEDGWVDWLAARCLPGGKD
ncbi:uncharacterized protein K452DRAFT_27230 [Aplosporella prunicola CBS 121167]|uniref:Uncharacterized protein n=1 Tax=Aplosporella prunicola CBS 121167 TaxID=1176127 RepID=A0A6A6BHX0_9PEZI|nr:uncharacterized protein K452DRAFT_27230 [Aplosporella prunicola CBS 121167]KAF2142141.1 hypothetical protein K452DRAFT_27230 [Aplosporella prunicola CBS 121167]